METLTFQEARDTFVDIVEKIKAVDPERGAYLARHIIINEMKGTVEYKGSDLILKKIMEDIKVLED